MDVRPITADEISAYRSAMVTTFGGDPSLDPHGEERLRVLLQDGRRFGAFDGGQIVGTAATFELTLTVPGGTLPMAGLTMVAVRPTHRRRGLLRRLMAAHLEDARARGEAISGLWSSEAGIYGRFGFGVASEKDELSFLASELSLDAGPPPDEVTMLDETAPAALAPLYDEVRAQRPGMLSRSPEWWRYRRFMERPEQVKGASPRRHVLARRDGRPTGYVVYRQRFSMPDDLPAGAVEVDELIAADAHAERSLWAFLAGVDLFPRVSWWNAPVDTPLPWMVSDARRVRRKRADALWLRIDDVAAVLGARRYSADGTLRLEITDPPATETRSVELSVTGVVAACTPTRAPAQLRLDRAAIGSLYLGAVSATTLARAGRVSGAPAAVALADRLFATPIAPWCEEVF